MQTKIDCLDVEALDRFERKLRNEGIKLPGEQRQTRSGSFLATKSIRDAVKSVRSLVRCAVKRGWLASDPSVAYDLPPEPESKIVTFSS